MKTSLPAKKDKAVLMIFQKLETKTKDLFERYDLHIENLNRI
jgi:hypothetical protein